MADGQTVKMAMEERRKRKGSFGHNLPAVTVPGWFKRRPDQLKRVIDKETNPNIKLAIERAKEVKKKKVEIVPLKPYLDEVIVLGERVFLNEEGVNAEVLKSSKPFDTAFFTPSYFPAEKDLNTVIKAKTVFSKVFLPGTKFGVDNPIPPCEVGEYNLLKEGLENRLYSLRMSLPEVEDIVSMNDRVLYERVEQFSAVIKAIESNNSICTNYELNFQTGMAKQTKGYTTPRKPLEREQFQNILRQFAFLILQSIHPISGHEDKIGDITPEFLISALQQQQISKEEMNAYIAEYTQTADNDIPDVIAQTLEASESQEDVYSLMIESEMQNLIEYLKNFILDNVDDLILKKKFTDHVSNIELSTIKDQLISIVKWLLEQYTYHKNLVATTNDTITTNKTASDSLYEELARKKEQIFSLESDIYAKTRGLENANKQIDTLNLKDSENKQQFDVLSKGLNKTNEELRQELAKRTGERDVLKEEIEKLRILTEKAIKEAAKARGITSVLNGALTTASKPKGLPFIKKVQQIANAVQNRTDPNIDQDSPFQELYRKFVDYTKDGEDLTDICYLNYFVSFFITRLFGYDDKLYKIMTDTVDNFLKDFEDLDTIMIELLNLLEIVESPSVKGVGYYTTNKEATPFLKKLYATINANLDINIRCSRAFTTSFNKFMTKPLYFVPPQEDDPVQHNGFFLRPLPTQGIPDNVMIYEWNGNEFKPLMNTFIPKTILNNQSLPYSTVFILYIMFAKNYLLKKQDSSCPIPKFFTDPTLLPKTKLKQSDVVTPR